MRLNRQAYCNAKTAIRRAGTLTGPGTCHDTCRTLEDFDCGTAASAGIFGLVAGQHALP